MKKLVILLIFASNMMIAKENFLLYDPSIGEENIYLDFIYDNIGTENSYLAFIALQRLTSRLFEKKDYKSIKNLYVEFKDDFPEFSAKINRIIEILDEPIYGLEELNLGNNINSDQLEYSPVPNSDESKLYFTGYMRENNNKTEDIYMSKRINGLWSPAVRLGPPINTDGNMEAPQCITTDDNTMILFGNLEGSLGRGDLFYSEKISKDDWSEIKHFSKPINSEYFDCDAKITNNGKAIIFVSDRPGGIGEHKEYGTYESGSMHGNTDIYICEKTEDGWSDPINLGDVINTPFAERKPFLHPDNMSLYFSSNGHPGLGRLDLYKSNRLNENSWTEWSEPINFGKQINSSKNERGAIINTFGQLAYFATAERQISFGKSDIYTITLPEHLRPNPVAIIRGKVLDIDGNPLDAKIVWENLTKGKLIGEMKSNPETGEYLIIFPVGKNYGFYAEKEGYFPISKNLDLTQETDTMIVEQDITMYPIDYILSENLNIEDNSLNLNSDMEESKKKLRINNLFFEYRKSEILSFSYPELDRVAYLLREYEEIEKIEIMGHSDSVGSENYNMELSQKRAEEVRDYLIQKGINEERLTATGYGENMPVADNGTEEGRKQNRRVELRVLKVRK